MGIDDFAEVDFDQDVSLAGYLRDCPASATTRGTFFDYVSQLAKRRDGTIDDRVFEGIANRRWVAFKTYPLHNFMRLCHNVSRIAYPSVPMGEALRRCGWLCYPSFAATMAGRVVLFAFGTTLEDVFLAAPRSYALGLPGSWGQVKMLGERHAYVEYRQVYSFASTYHVGVIEGAIKSFGFSPHVRIRTYPQRSDIDLDVRW